MEMSSATNISASFMYANCYGLDGVTKLIQILKTEIAADAAQAGVADLRNVSRSLVSASQRS